VSPRFTAVGTFVRDSQRPSVEALFGNEANANLAADMLNDGDCSPGLFEWTDQSATMRSARARRREACKKSHQVPGVSCMTVDSTPDGLRVTVSSVSGDVPIYATVGECKKEDVTGVADRCLGMTDDDRHHIDKNFRTKDRVFHANSDRYGVVKQSPTMFRGGTGVDVLFDDGLYAAVSVENLEHAPDEDGITRYHTEQGEVFCESGVPKPEEDHWNRIQAKVDEIFAKKPEKPSGWTWTQVFDCIYFFAPIVASLVGIIFLTASLGREAAILRTENAALKAKLDWWECGPSTELPPAPEVVK